MFKNFNIIVLITCSLFSTVLFSGLDKPSLQLSHIEEYSLDNGMRVLISPNYDYPVVYCHLYINSGEIDDQQHGGRLAEMTYWELFKGTEKYPSKTKILEKIRELGDDGGRFNLKDQGLTYSEIGSYFLREDIEPALELYAEIIQRPTFNSSNIKLLGKLIGRLGLITAPKDWLYGKSKLLHRHLHDLYDHHKTKIHPKYWLFKFKKKDLKNWHKANIHPENTTLMITGDVNYSYVKNIINEYFGNWSALKDSPERPAFKINENPGIKMRFVNMKDLTKAEIWIGQPEIIPAYNWFQNDKYIPAVLAKKIFMGENFGRLASIQDSLDGFEKTDEEWWSTIGSKIKYNDLSEYYDLIISEFDKMSYIRDSELLAAKKIESNKIINNLNKPENFTRYIQHRYNNNDFNMEKIEASFDEINSVSLNDVQKVASKMYNRNNFILLLMGNKDSCATFLERFEDFEYYEQEEEVR